MCRDPQGTAFHRVPADLQRGPGAKAGACHFEITTPVLWGLKAAGCQADRYSGTVAGGERRYSSQGRDHDGTDGNPS